MAVQRLAGGNTPANGGDPRTFPAIWNGTADDLEAGEYSKVPSGGSAGEVLVKQSGTDFDLGYEEHPDALMRSVVAWEAGEGWGLAAAASGNLSMTEGREFSVPIYIPSGAGIDRILINVTVAGAAGSVIRLGLRANDNQGWPGTLIVDAGTVDSTTTGSKTVTIDVSAATVGNRFVWMSAVAQGAASSQPSVSQMVNQPVGQYGAFRINFVAHDGNIYFARRQDSVTGALPSGVTSPNYIQVAPAMRVRLQ
jgi:hypothetical protein